MTEQQIQEQVMIKYPELARERKCATMRMLRNQLRERYRNELTATIQLSAGNGTPDAEIRAGISTGDGKDIAGSVS